MSRELRIVGTFATPVEADAVRALLNAAGIRSVLADEATVGMNWMLGNAVRGVKVLVADDDLVRAVQIVSEAADAAHEFARRQDEPPDWKCLLCGEEVSGDFDVCWSCGATRGGAADPDAHGSANEEVGKRDPVRGAVYDDPISARAIRDAAVEAAQLRIRQPPSRLDCDHVAAKDLMSSNSMAIDNRRFLAPADGAGTRALSAITGLELARAIDIVGKNLDSA